LKWCELQPGVWSRQAAAADRHGMTLVKSSASPKSTGTSQSPAIPRSGACPPAEAACEDNRRRPDDTGYVAEGGGGMRREAACARSSTKRKW
jgi:hypothetical protein